MFKVVMCWVFKFFMCWVLLCWIPVLIYEPNCKLILYGKVGCVLSCHILSCPVLSCLCVEVSCVKVCSQVYKGSVVCVEFLCGELSMTRVVHEISCHVLNWMELSVGWIVCSLCFCVVYWVFLSWGPCRSCLCVQLSCVELSTYWIVCWAFEIDFSQFIICYCLCWTLYNGSVFALLSKVWLIQLKRLCSFPLKAAHSVIIYLLLFFVYDLSVEYLHVWWSAQVS